MAEENKSGFLFLIFLCWIKEFLFLTLVEYPLTPTRRTTSFVGLIGTRKRIKCFYKWLEDCLLKWPIINRSWYKYWTCSETQQFCWQKAKSKFASKNSKKAHVPVSRYYGCTCDGSIPFLLCLKITAKKHVFEHSGTFPFFHGSQWFIICQCLNLLIMHQLI